VRVTREQGPAPLELISDEVKATSRAISAEAVVFAAKMTPALPFSARPACRAGVRLSAAPLRASRDKDERARGMCGLETTALPSLIIGASRLQDRPLAVAGSGSTRLIDATVCRSFPIAARPCPDCSLVSDPGNRSRVLNTPLNERCSTQSKSSQYTPSWRLRTNDRRSIACVSGLLCLGGRWAVARSTSRRRLRRSGLDDGVRI